ASLTKFARQNPSERLDFCGVPRRLSVAKASSAGRLGGTLCCACCVGFCQRSSCSVMIFKPLVFVHL
ncbi:unnamed protein product, partial [Musa textilis]